MAFYSEEQVIALSPDDSSVKSGRELANARKWVGFFAADNCLWGECQGSGSKPYQTCIDLSEPAFKCSCPSRKFPCKHGLGLLLLFARESSAFAQIDPPDWVNQWLQSRQQRQEKKARKKEESEQKTPDPKAKEKRQTDRLAKVQSGLSEFSLWLHDRMRHGLAGMESQSYQYWEGMAARLTDAQAPGLARIVRQCAGIANSGEGWQASLLDRLSQLHIAVEGFARIEELDLDLQEDLRAVIGFTTSQDEVLAKSGVRDRWQILGQRVDLEDRLKVQRTWLRGEQTKRWALILSFAYGMQALDISLATGTISESELVFFPSRLPLRALVKSKAEAADQLRNFVGYENTDEFLDEYATAIASNPWLESFPIALNNVRAMMSPEQELLLIDNNMTIIPQKITKGLDWHLLALTGGQPFSIFGEWNGEAFLPLSLICDGHYHRLDVRNTANVA